MAISQTDDDGNSIESFLQTVDSSTSAVKGHVRLSDKDDSGDFLLFAISDLTDQGSYWTINIGPIGVASSVVEHPAFNRLVLSSNLRRPTFFNWVYLFKIER